MSVARALLPSEETLGEWVDLGAARVWASVADDVWLKIATELGDPELSSLALFAALVPAALRAAVGAVGLTPLQEVKVKLLFAAARVKYGMEPVDFQLVATTVVQMGGGGSGLSGPGERRSSCPVLKVRVATVLDQSSDREVELLGIENLSMLRKAFRVNQGEDPLENEEVTDEQLSALVQVVAAGGAPYADFGVWGPHGNRIAKALRFTHHFLDGTGTLRTKNSRDPTACRTGNARGGFSEPRR